MNHNNFYFVFYTMVCNNCVCLLRIKDALDAAKDTVIDGLTKPLSSIESDNIDMEFYTQLTGLLNMCAVS